MTIFQVQISGYIFSTCTDCIKGSASSTHVIFENFLVFYFPFWQIQRIISSWIFTEIGDKCCLIFWVLTHKSWVSHRLYICKSCWNGLLQSSISDDYSKGCRVQLTSTHLFNFFKPFDIASLSHLYIFQILLISLQMLVRLFVSNSII